MYSIIFYLNDCHPAECGGTRFYADEAKGKLVLDDMGRYTADPALALTCVAAKKGRALVFYHNHIHEGTPPAPGAQKYIIRSDLMYHRAEPICTLPQDVEAYGLYQRAVDIAGESGREAEAMPMFARAFKMSRNLADVYGM